MQETATKPIDRKNNLSEVPIEGADSPILVVRILREPLLHFLILGVLIFGLYFGVSGGSTKPESSQQQIEISAGTVENLKATWKMQWGREPNPEQLEKLMDTYIRDEVLYREALALKLDDNDTIVRRRLVQKMQFLVQDVSAIEEPSDETLQAYLADNADRYAIPGRVSFSHIYFSRELRGDKANADAQALLRELQANGNSNPYQLRGDRSMLPGTYSLASARTLNNTFGGSFAQGIAAVTEKGWHGPFESAYGSHLVNVTQVEPAHPATLAEVRRNVRLDWLRDERQKRDDLFYEQLRDRYEISIKSDLSNPGSEEG